MNLSVPIVSAAVGAVILLFGRKLFWLFVAAVGFAAGIEIAPQLMHEPTPMLALSCALIFGFVGALLALFLQKIAVAVGGFLAGGQLAVALASAFYEQAAGHHWLIFAVGGVIGAVLLLSLFNWALIVLSSIVGAHLIMSAMHLPASGFAIAFIALTVVGVVAQSAMFRRKPV